MKVDAWKREINEYGNEDVMQRPAIKHLDTLREAAEKPKIMLMERLESFLIHVCMLSGRPYLVKR